MGAGLGQGLQGRENVRREGGCGEPGELSKAPVGGEGDKSGAVVDGQGAGY